MLHVKPPKNIDKLKTSKKKKVFLGGSIEMGKAEDWQTKIVKHFDKPEYEELILFNPRRDDWDSSWVHDPTPGTKFHGQVTWEIEAQDHSDLNVYYFVEDTMSPITLLELGAYSKGNTIVRVTEGYERYGNVVIFCKHMNIPIFDTIHDINDEIKWFYYNDK